MASILKVDKLDPQSGTALELGTSGDTISVPSGATLDISASTLTPPATMPASSGVNLTALNATQLTSGTVPDARFTTLPAVSGVNLTSLNATNLGSGTVPTARLGSGTASSSTVLYGDQTYKAEPSGGKVLQVVQGSKSGYVTTTSDSTYTATGLSCDIVPQTGSSVLVLVTQVGCTWSSTGVDIDLRLMHQTTNVKYTPINLYGEGVGNPGNMVLTFHYLDTSPGGDGSTTINYFTDFRIGDDAGTAGVQNYGTSMMQLIEIGT